MITTYPNPNEHDDTKLDVSNGMATNLRAVNGTLISGYGSYDGTETPRLELRRQGNSGSWTLAVVKYDENGASTTPLILVKSDGTRNVALTSELPSLSSSTSQVKSGITFHFYRWGRVVTFFAVTGTLTTARSNGQSIGTLPSAYYPMHDFNFIEATAKTRWTIVASNGQIQYTDSGSVASGSYFRASGTYICKD